MFYNMVKGIGIVLTVIFVIVLCSFFADFYWDPPAPVVDTTQMMQVMVDNPDGTVTLTAAPVFSSGPDARTTRMKSETKNWLIIGAVVLAFLLSGYSFN